MDVNLEVIRKGIVIVITGPDPITQLHRDICSGSAALWTVRTSDRSIVCVCKLVGVLLPLPALLSVEAVSAVREIDQHLLSSSSHVLRGN